MKDILGIEIDEKYFDELMCRQSQGGEIKKIDDKVFCLMPYETVINGEITDISSTREHREKIAQQEKEKTLTDLRLQVEELDKKRIRAVCEPEIKDMESGQTWLEYYTEQITAIRTQIADL